jgi:hypothetical protein
MPDVATKEAPPLSALSDDDLRELAAGTPPLEQLSDEQLAGVAVHQGLMQPEEAQAAVVQRKQVPRRMALDLATQAMTPVERGFARTLLTRGGRAGDVAANVVPAIAGSVAGTIAEPGVGTIVGGAAGGAAGESLVQARQYFRGERDKVSPGAILAMTAANAIPVGGPLLKTAGRTILTRAVQGAGIAGAADVTRQLIDTAKVDFGQLAESGAFGALFGGSLGGVEAVATRRAVLGQIRRTPEFSNFQGNDAELVQAVRTKLAAEQPVRPEPRPVEPVAPEGTPPAAAPEQTAMTIVDQPPPGGWRPEDKVPPRPGAPATIEPVAPTIEAPAVAAPPKPLAELTDAELVAVAKETPPPEPPAAATPTAQPEAAAIGGEAAAAPAVAGAEQPAGTITTVKSKGARFRFAPRPDGVFDIIDAIQEMRGVPRPPAGAKGKGGEWDGFKETFQGSARILTKATTGGIDVFLKDLGATHPEFAHLADDMGAFYNSVTVALAERGRLKRATAIEGQQNKFMEAALEGKGRPVDQKVGEPVPVNDLAVGAKFTVKREPFEVVDVSPDDNSVVVKDGPRYGTQILPPDALLHPDKGTYTPAKPPTGEFLPPEESAPTTPSAGGELIPPGEMPFNLAGEAQAEPAAPAPAAEATAEMFAPGQVRSTAPTALDLANAAARTRGTSAIGDPMMPPPPPGTPVGTHANQRMPVTMERIMPGLIDVPTVMDSLENVVRVLGGESPIRSGRFYAQARGIFKTFSEVIRLREADNIPTAAHEVGHAFSKQLFGSPKSRALMNAMASSPRVKPALQELRALGHALYGNNRPAAGYTAEGFAELVRLWLTTESAASRAPQATAWLEQELLGTQAPLAKALRQARDKIDLWRGQGAQARATAQMKEPPGRLARLRENVAKVLGPQAQIEEFRPLQELSSGFARIAGRKLTADRDPYLLATAYRKTAGATLETMVERGMVDPWGNITGPNLKEAFAGIKPDQALDFAHYLWARRAIERWGKGKNPGMALEDAQYLRQKLETPAFINSAQKYYQWWDGVLEYLKQAAPEINGPLVEAIRAGSHDYVPLARDLSSVEAKAAAAGGLGGGLRRMHGSGLPVKNLYLQSLLVAEKLIARAHRDLVLDSILNLGGHEGMGWLVEEVPATKVMESVNIEKIREELISYGVDTESIPADTLVKFATQLDAPRGADPIVVRRTAAGTKWYQVPADVYDLLNKVETPARLGWAFELLFGAPARLLKLGTTGLRASFSLVTNPARDLPTYMMQSVAGNPASRAAAWAESLANVVRAGLTGKESPEFELFHQLGISTANFLGGDIRQAQREVKGLFHGKLFRRVMSPIETAREAMSFSETGPRLAEMTLLAREMGWKPGDALTPEQATILRVAAKRVTVDFSAAGGMGREINRAVAFYNPAIQGVRSFARAFKNDQGTKQRSAAALKAVLNGVMLLTLPVLYNWWKNRDKEWYRMLPWRERYLYINVERGGNVYQVPLPQEWGSAFAVLPLAAFDSWYQRDTRPMEEAVNHIFNILNPVDYPVLAKAAKEQWSNRIDFFDKPIIPRGELDLRPGDQRSYYSSWLATMLGDVFPGSVSPRRFDAAVRELGGGAAADLVDAPGELMRLLGLPAHDLPRGQQPRQTEPADLPIAGRVFRRGGTFSANTQPLVEFWDDFNRYTQWHASNMKALRAGRQPLTPMSFKEQAYAAQLQAAEPAIKMALEIASRTPETIKRQELYRRTAVQAQQFISRRPR